MPRESRNRPSFSLGAAASLTAVNILGAVAALAFGLSAHALMRVYWLQAFTVGIYACANILLAQRVGPVGSTKPYKLVLFGAHYGTCCVFYMQLLAFLSRDESISLLAWLPFLPLFLLAHGIAFKLVSYDSNDRGSVSAFHAMFVPYARTVPVQLPLLAVYLALPGAKDSPVAIGVLAAAMVVFDLLGLHVAQRIVVPRIAAASGAERAE